MKKKTSALMLSLPLLGVAGAIEALSGGSKPNVIMIYVDDLGYGDLSCYGSTLTPTPHIDMLAHQGVRFTRNYVMAPVSSPSRVGLMSGCYPTHWGMDANNAKDFTLPPAHKLMPQAFQEAGYMTGISGKWNIPVKNDKMFDFVRHRINFAASYWPDEKGVYNGVDNNLTPILENGLWRDGSNGEQYLTDMVFDAAVEFLKGVATQQKPFFLYVAPNAPHYPLQAHTRYLERVSHIKNPAFATYAAMIMALDDDVGRMLEVLKANGQIDRTVIVFSSDNGPSTASGRSNTDAGSGGKSWHWPEEWPTNLMFYSTNGMKGSKGSLHEGGICLPLLVYYPPKIKGGTVCTAPVAMMDIYPTLCSVCGIPMPAGTVVDGKDISPLMYGQSDKSPHDCIYWKIRDQGAVLQGEWKLYFDKKEVALYDLSKDVNETVNLASKYPELTKELKEKWDKWYSVSEPIFSKQ